MDFKLELVAIPVSDVDRAMAFYTEQAGFISTMITPSDRAPVRPAHAAGLRLFDRHRDRDHRRGARFGRRDAARRRRHRRRPGRAAGRGVDTGEIQDFPWGRFIFFADPDGNRWAVQEIQRPG